MPLIITIKAEHTLLMLRSIYISFRYELGFQVLACQTFEHYILGSVQLISSHDKTVYRVRAEKKQRASFCYQQG